MTTTKNILISR